MYYYHLPCTYKSWCMISDALAIGRRRAAGVSDAVHAIRYPMLDVTCALPATKPWVICQPSADAPSSAGPARTDTVLCLKRNLGDEAAVNVTPAVLSETKRSEAM